MKISKQKIDIVMARKCITASELAEKAQMPKSTFNAIIGGRNAKPITVGKIAKALNVDVTEIIEQ